MCLAVTKAAINQTVTSGFVVMDVDDVVVVGGSSVADTVDSKIKLKTIYYENNIPIILQFLSQ